MTGAAVGGAVLHGCSLESSAPELPSESPRLTARPKVFDMPETSGRIIIEQPTVDAVLYVPPSVLELESAPLVVFLHGALRTVDFFVDGFMKGADENKVIVLAPYAEFGTWDAISYNYFGPDIVGINSALAWVFARWPIDPTRIVLSGFSDGGSYSLAVGRANGDLFSRVVAYSPGYLIGVDPVGQPPLLVTHGYDDTVLPYLYTAEFIVPELMRAGYQVDFRSFQGPHAVPLSIANEVMSDLATAQGHARRATAYHGPRSHGIVQTIVSA